jgi:uncharacterized protein (DUF1697 family)
MANQAKKAVPRAGVHVALLRGINVGGKNLLRMEHLVRIFEAAGCRAVRTYIQSGNVIFTASPALVRRLPTVVSRAIAKEAGLEVPVVLRSADELAVAARANPYRGDGVDAGRVYVAFLAERPSATAVAGLDPQRSPPDEFTVRDREIYLHLRNGAAGTRLTNAYFDSKLGTVSTLRNTNTVAKLVDLCRA